MKFPPFPTLRATLRVMLKAIILAVVINVICLVTHFNPVATLTRLNLWGLVGNGRARLIYQSDVRNGFLPIESLLATHVLAYTPKAPDEFRVFVFGNSGPYGAGLDDEETLAGQLNQANIRINGKRVVVYNLAFPNSNVVTCTLILNAALRYQPDLAITFVTANMFNNEQTYWDQTQVMINLNRERLEQLAAEYGMTDWLEPRLSPRPFGYELLGIRDQNTLIPWFDSLFYPFVQYPIVHPNRRIAQEPLPATPNNFEAISGTYPVLNPTWDFLTISAQMMQAVGGRFWVINQPTVVIGGPHSDDSYSPLYGRAFYDAYEATIQSYTQTRHLWYTDMWQVVPAEYYTDSELHLNKQGTSILAKTLTAELTTAYNQ